MVSDLCLDALRPLRKTGWTYNLDGKLTKAPKFDEAKDFDGSAYSLFKIHTHVDRTGFVWVNFDASDSPMPWEQMNGGTDEQPRLNDFSLDNYVYHRTWTTNGQYNWKLVGDNYNEVGRCAAWIFPTLTDSPSAIIARPVTLESPRSPIWINTR